MLSGKGFVQAKRMEQTAQLCHQGSTCYVQRCQQPSDNSLADVQLHRAAFLSKRR